ncbi:FecR family protein [Blastopirellula sp. JC732]|uniref:FecR family protein n=1 Tax=Blastopirellula sediminis TaxID=2894196 RepID=A0A9X1MNJ9_9BACT|nr:FecR domain-containing protein [Blastopirellula sediminis]MCC9606158.1 FecR family protein [Blastopirellula sediminis]MCC9630543.1 FecR family protein [Blastopirellula sediminis]
MNVPERFSELWTDYLEGELDEAGMAELRDMLAADESLLQLAADMYQTHRLLGLAVAEVPSRQDQFVEEVMSRLPEDSQSFVSGVMADVGRLATASVQKKEAAPPARSQRRSAMYFVVALSLLAVVSYGVWTTMRSDVAQSTTEESLDGKVRFTSMARAKFFGELAPPARSVLTPLREYVLMSGLVKIKFPAGATAIVEGPAVFRVLSDECLALDIGRCSVHAPDGAEGFRVETPVTHVVDRGTRFTVNVSEMSETEVQVIEGAADVYEANPTAKPARDEIRLTDGKALKLAKGRVFAANDIPFDASTYRRGLPDRIVSYKATKAADGGAEDLISVTVQRDGRIREILVEDLIPSHVTAFKAVSTGAYLCGKETLPSPRIETSSDCSLVTGVINPGGSVEPLTSDPVLSGESATPGLAIQFDQPIVNGPGPDVVFFDLQTFSNPPDGDAFHISPLKFHDGLKSHTIRVYDLTMESASVCNLTDFYVHMYGQPAASLAELESLEATPIKQGIRFRGLAVGIDLSDLGYAPGEKVEGLFFQDAMDDGHYVDPVYVGGLPAIR